MGLIGQSLVLCWLVFDIVNLFLWHQVQNDQPVMSRITAVLPYNDTLWVGTADGHLTIYNVMDLECPSPKPISRWAALNTETYFERNDNSAIQAK